MPDKNRMQMVVQPIAFGWQNSAQQGASASASHTPTLDKSKVPAIAYPINTQIATRHEAMGEGTGMGIGNTNDPAYTLQSAHSHAVGVGMQVRRLTPVECERLQGFPDGYTDIKRKGKSTPDGPRYKALGNSMAVPVMRWIGERIKQVEEL
jgi:DNA (cytosine-5)-methyltransferase 1